MKKLMIMAVAALMSASAMAQNPDALKQVKKVKTAQEAVALIEANKASMTAAENAQAYGKLADLYYAPVEKTVNAITLHQQGLGDEPKYDKNEFAQQLSGVYEAALMCDKYDMQPNEKGKVAPKFRKKNADRLYNLRIHLLIAAQDYFVAEDYVGATPLYVAYAKSGLAPMFQEAKAEAEKAGQKDEYIGDVAKQTAQLLIQNKMYAEAIDYTDFLALDPVNKDFAVLVKMSAMQQTVGENHEDSVKFLGHLEELHAQYPANDDVFGTLAQWYSNLGQNAKQDAFVAEYLQKNPGSFMAWAMKGQNEMNAQKLDDAIESYKKAADCDVPDPMQKAVVYSYIGICNNAKAAQLEKYEDQIEQIKKSIPWLEKARELDPNLERSNWKYPLFQAYYNVYGEDDPRTKEVQ